MNINTCNTSAKYLCIGILGLIGINTVSAQDTYLNPNSLEYQLVDRLETKSGQINGSFSTANQPLSRKKTVQYFSDLNREQLVGRTNFSKIDEFNIERAINISGEWYENASGESGFVNSKRPILKYFYQKPADFINIETDNFFLVVNPVLYVQAGYEMDEGLKPTNTRGIELRGRIANKIGFYTMMADNQEKLPGYTDGWVNRHRGQMPSNHLSVLRDGTFDVFLARGYVDFSLIKNFVNVTFGYDKQQVGYGIRSLVLSNDAAPSSFLRFRSNWKKFSYESLILEQIANRPANIGDAIYPKKYAAIHQLNYNVSKKLSIGLFESTAYEQTKGIPAAIFVPVIGFQSVAKQVANSNSNNAWGLQFKSLPIKDVQIYGQAFLDKLDLGAIGKGSWKNQYGLQLGLKYYDVATVKNLDGQIEINAVRPFTYAGEVDSFASFTHYNQPMAHALGNNFVEIIGNLKYQPSALWTISGRAIYSTRGLNLNANDPIVGNGIFNVSGDRSFARENSYSMFVGNKNKTIFANLNIAYELRPNLFLEAGGTAVRSNYDNVIANQNSIYFYGGLRWNIARTLYDLY